MKKVLLILPVSRVVLGGFSLAYALSGGGPVLAPGDESMYRDEGPDEEPEVRLARLALLVLGVMMMRDRPPSGPPY